MVFNSNSLPVDVILNLIFLTLVSLSNWIFSPHFPFPSVYLLTDLILIISVAVLGILLSVAG